MRPPTTSLRAWASARACASLPSATRQLTPATEDSMTDQISEALIWCLGLGLCAVTVLLVRQHGITALQRRRNTDLSDGLRARDEELRHLVSVRLPALEDVTPQPVPAAGLLESRLAGTDFAKCLDAVLERFSQAVAHAQSRADQSAKAALKASMRSIQALA